MRPVVGLAIVGMAVAGVVAASELRKRSQEPPTLEPGLLYRWTIRVRSDAPGAQNVCEQIRQVTAAAAKTAAGQEQPITDCEVAPLEVRFTSRYLGSKPVTIAQAIRGIESTGYVEVLAVEPRDEAAA